MKKKMIGIIMVLFIGSSLLYSFSNGNIEEIDQWILENMEEGHIPGIALSLMDHRNSPISRGYGCETPHGNRVTEETQFYVGSITKTLTAIAIIQLVEQGEIELQVPFIEYLPDMDFSESMDNVSVQQLLNHSSGIPNRAGLHFSRRLLGKSFSQWDVYSSLRVSPEKIGEFSYSNMNYNILGLIIEEVSRKEYTEYMELNILRPLGMNQTVPSHQSAHRLTHGYTLWFNHPRYIGKPDEYRNYFPAMGYISNLKDLQKLVSFLMNPEEETPERIISKAGVDQLFYPSVESDFDGTSGYYGMGWQITSINETPCYFIQGGARGTSSYIYILPEEELALISLTNMNSIFQAKHSRSIIPGIINILNNEPTSLEGPSNTFAAILTFLCIIIAVNLIYILVAHKWNLLAIKVSTITINMIGIILFYFVMPQLWDIPLSAMYFGKPDLFWLMIIATIFISMTFISITLKKTLGEKYNVK